MYQLYYFPGSANLAPHILLGELNLEFELIYVDRDCAAHKRPEYLQMNPSGRIPVLIDGDLVLYETAAICLHLVDTHPDCGLIPVPGSAARAGVYKWLMYLTNTLQTELMVYFYPQRLIDGEQGAAQVKAHAQQRISDMLDLLEAELLERGPYLAGSEYSLLDGYLFMLCHWTREMDAPARQRPRLKALLEALLAREAVQRALSGEGIQAPYI